MNSLACHNSVVLSGLQLECACCICVCVCVCVLYVCCVCVCCMCAVCVCVVVYVRIILSTFASLADPVDNKELPENMSQPLSMSGNGSDDVIIPSVFVTHANGKLLTELLEKETRVLIRLQEMEITSTGELM